MDRKRKSSTNSKTLEKEEPVAKKQAPAAEEPQDEDASRASSDASDDAFDGYNIETDEAVWLANAKAAIHNFPESKSFIISLFYRDQLGGTNPEETQYLTLGYCDEDLSNSATVSRNDEENKVEGALRGHGSTPGSCYGYKDSPKEVAEFLVEGFDEHDNNESLYLRLWPWDFYDDEEMEWIGWSQEFDVLKKIGCLEINKSSQTWKAQMESIVKTLWETVAAL